jgi:hypothetical protein
VTFSYSGDPSASDLDEVRFLISDTNEAEPLLSDEEIAYVIATWNPLYGSNTLTAAVCCEIVAGKFAGSISVSADGVSVALSELQGKYEQLAASLRDQYKQQEALGNPSFSGTLFDDTWDATIKPLTFGKGFMDNYLAGRQNFGDYDPGEMPSYGPETEAWY